MEPNKFLLEINKVVTDWLKFAEAKNSALLAGNLAIVFGVSKLSIFSEATHCSWIWFYYITICIFCGLSALTCMISIVPQIKLPCFVQSGAENKVSNNLVFYGSIATHTSESYSESLQKALNVNFNLIEFSLCGQIVINSQIARRKYKFFKVAAWLFLSAFLTPVISLIIILSCKE